MKNKIKKILVILFSVLAAFIITYAVIGVVYVNEKPATTLAENSIGITTYSKGFNQPTHPSIISFNKEDGWNGYKYWLSYSPYPYEDGDEENPCVVASNDLQNWITPMGLANPIATNEETECDELKDPHILYREDLDRIEVWYLGRISENMGGDGTSLTLFRKYSYDGKSWSNYEVMNEHMLWLSPTIWWDGEQYNVWAIGYDMWNTAGDFVYLNSEDGKTWSEPISCTIDGVSENLDMWHGTVSFYDDEYHLVYIDNQKQKVFYTRSTDGINFVQPATIVDNDGFYDHLYRPTLLIEEDRTTCFYGIINDLDQWSIGMSQGETALSLQSVNGTSKISNLHNVKGFLKLSKSYFDSNIRLNFKQENILLRIVIFVITIVVFAIISICFIYGIVKIFKKDR